MSRVGEIMANWISIGLVLIFIIWLISVLKNKKALLFLPFLLILFITPIYNLLDSKLFIHIFGCGCVPTVQQNMLNIPFNANHLRQTIYGIFFVILIIIGIKLSKQFTKNSQKIIYLATLILYNIFLILKILEMYMWN